MTSELRDAALQLADRGWPILPVKAQGKEPLTAHGVTDATTNTDQIRTWWQRWPQANIGVACGTPGPTVLDVDNPVQARPLLDRLEPLHAPTAATARGRHLYFAGTTQGTISLGYGELRGQGSYVIAPPSAHPTGKLYVWLEAPNGRLPRVPDMLIGQRTSAGVGDHHEPKALIPHGERHDALKDAAVRFLRGGFTDVATLEQMLKLFYQARCERTPPARRDEFRKLAEWAAGTGIADRERALAPPDPPPEEVKKAKKPKDDLDRPPGPHATLAELRAYITLAGGWGSRVDVAGVHRPDSRLTSRLTIGLTNGQRIVFVKQEQITTRPHWARTVIAATNGTAVPRNLTDTQALSVYRCLCALADAPAETREREETDDAIADLLAETELEQPRQVAELGVTWWFWAIGICRARAKYDPRNPETHPILLEAPDGTRYLRAGELADYLRHRGLDIPPTELEGRLADIGWTRQAVDGREPPRADDQRRRMNRMVVYRMPEEQT